MKFYTHVQQWGNHILVREIDNGEQKTKRVKYEPTLYVPVAKQTPYKSLDGKYLSPIKQLSIKDAKEFVEQYKDQPHLVYGNTQFAYTYLSDTYPNEVEYDMKQLLLYTIDIEVQCENGFPNPQQAIEPMLSITVKNHKNQHIVVWGLGEFKTDREDVHYINCKDEKELLEEFMLFWQQTTPDIVTGWNVDFFDIPYLMNRIKLLFGEDKIKCFSPWGNVTSQEKLIMGRKNQMYDIMGVSILDYLDLYRKHTFVRRESYKLDYIGEVELGENKHENPYDTFKEFYTKDYQQFIEYNIQDVELVDKLEDKMKLIELHLTMAYEAKVNYQDVFGQVRMWDTIIFNHLKSKNIVAPTVGESKKSSSYEGAYVKDPVVGFHDWIVSFDLNSLYPHLIMQYNISPETMVGYEPNRVNVENMLNQKSDLSDLDTRTITPNGALFRTDKQGFLPELMDKLYKERVIYKDKMAKAKALYQETGDERLKNEISSNYNIQLSRKIALNSAYGAIGNQYFRYFDVRHAEGITMAGQLTIRWIERDVNEYLNKLLKTKNVTYVVASDTDSIYINLGEMVNKVFKNSLTSLSIHLIVN